MRVHFLSVLTLAITLFSGVSELRAAESGPTRKLPPKVDVYELDISLDTDKHTLEVRRMILHYRNVGDQSLDEIVLRLDTNLNWAGTTEILSVSGRDGGKLQWRYLPFRFGELESDKAQLGISLPKPLEREEEVELRIDFRRSPRLVEKELTLLLDDPSPSFDAWYPKAMTRKGGKWSIDDDRPSVYDVTVELPADLTIASTGKVVEQRAVADGRRVLRLRAEGVRGFTIYGSHLWKKHRRKVEGIELSVCLPDEAEHWADRLLEATADTIAFSRTEYGEFPAQHLDIVCPGSLTGHPHGVAAACNIMIIWLNNLMESRYRRGIAHEVPHQYFGSLIGVHRETLGWVPMGLALMMEQHYVDDRGVDNRPARRSLEWAYFELERRGYDSTLSQPLEKFLKAGPPLSFGWNMALTHGKAYAVCSLLEDLVGREKSKEVIRKLVAERPGTMIGSTDLIDYYEEAAGESLDWFAADWIDGRATLDYSVSDAKRAENGWLVEVTRVGTAKYPVTVEAVTVTGVKFRQRIDRQKKSNQLLFTTNDDLKEVIVDPDGGCPDLDRSNNRWPARATQ